MDLNILNFGTAIFSRQFLIVLRLVCQIIQTVRVSKIWTIHNNDRFGSSERLICIELAESSLIIFSFFPNQRITSDHFLQEENNRVRRAKENMAEELNHPNTVG